MYFLWEAVDTTDFSTLDITFPVTICCTMRVRLRHHETKRDKQEFRTFVVQQTFATMEGFCKVFRYWFKKVVGYVDYINYNIAETTNLQLAIGKNFPLRNFS